MSASENSSLAYQSTATLAESESMLATGNVGNNVGISVTSRIDYNLRFTKQAVLVVGNNTEQYSQLASEFLVNLSTVKPSANQLDNQENQINVAFISASTKLNDIQIRCRLIEQLFVKALFDPEESLAISIFRFAKQHGEAISIVIDHAHALSLQLNYELCQLVALAKKHQLTINVVLFGLTEAAQQLTINKSLFKNKLVIIEAETGQVISLDDKRISLKKEAKPLSIWHKLSLVGAILLLAAIFVWVYLVVVEEVNEQALITSSEGLVTSSVNKTANTSIATENTLNNEGELLASAVEAQSSSLTLDMRQASSEEINQVLLATNSVHTTNNAVAEAGDVLQALVIAESNVVDSDTNKAVDTANRTTKAVKQQAIPALTINNYYHLQAKKHKNGYVVQIAGFADETLSQRFLARYPTQQLYSYQRELNNKAFIVITSQVFASKAEAKAAIKLLPITLIERQPWVKSISSVIKEINTFTR